MGRRRVEVGGDVWALGARIEAWRQGKTHRRDRMPEELWQEAVTLARVHGPAIICRALSLGWIGMRQRMEAAFEAPSVAATPSETAFVELEPWGQGGPMPVEVDRPDGARLRLQVQSGMVAEAAALLKAFMGQAG